jgi:hypothetical protein
MKLRLARKIRRNTGLFIVSNSSYNNYRQTTRNRAIKRLRHANKGLASSIMTQYEDVYMSRLRNRFETAIVRPMIDHLIKEGILSKTDYEVTYE